MSDGGQGGALVTVIVPASNSGPFVASTVHGALEQDRSAVEVLVVDDGSSDDGPAGLSWVDDPRVRVFCQPRRGLARTLNLALALARTPWVSVASPPDVLAPGWLAAVRARLDEEPRPAAVFVRAAPVDAFGEAITDVDDDDLLAACGTAPLGIRAALLERSFLSFSGTLFDRTLALRVGGFDPSLRWALDRDLWLRLLAEGPAVLVPRRLVETRWRGTAGSAASEGARAEHAYVVAKALGEASFEGAPLDLARSVLRARLPGTGGLAAELVARARAQGSQPPATDPDLAELLQLFPGLSGDVELASRDATETGPRTRPGAGSSPLRIALEVTELDRGGLEAVVMRLARALHAAGHEPLVVCTQRGGAAADTLRAAGIEVVILEGAERATALGRLLVERGTQLLNTHFSTFGARIAAALDIPVVSTLHNAYAWLGSGVLDEMRAVDPLVTGYVAVSESVADFCARRFAIARSRMVVIRNAIEPVQLASAAGDRASARRLLGIPVECRLLVQVGRIDPIKCQLALVEAQRRLAPVHPELRAWIVGGVGDAAYAQRLRARISETGMSERIAVVGERSDVPTILAAADVFVMPSVLEGLSLAAIEAMAAGVPAVLTRTGDAAWLLGEDESRGNPTALPGALIDGPDIDVHVHSEVLNRIAASAAPPHAAALADAIAAVLDDLPRRSDLARTRAATLACQLAPEAWVRSHLELFTRVAADGALRQAAALARATRRLDAEAAAVRQARAPFERAVDGLSRVLAGNLASRRVAAHSARTRGELALARATFGAAGDALVRSLEKLRLTDRVRAAWRSLASRRPGGS